MSAYNKFNCFVGDLANGVHNLTTATLKVMLTDTAPVATNTIKSNITEIAAGNGYVAGGIAAALVSDNDVSGLFTLIIAQPSVTASGGNIAQFRYAVLYNSSNANGNLIAWFDFGAEVNLTNGNTFTVAFNQSTGVFTLQ
jgi:hypothetical protein